VLEPAERGAQDAVLAAEVHLLLEVEPHLAQTRLDPVAERAVVQASLRLDELVVLLALHGSVGVRNFGVVGVAHASAFQRWKRTYLYTNSSALRVSE